jgi:excinuclease ABC subunit B
MGRAARNVNGGVVLYADETTDAMQAAIEETRRRRRIQREFNEEHGTTPTTIDKSVGDMNLPGAETDTSDVAGDGPEDEQEAAMLVEELEERMNEAASNLEFELAADIRDRMRELREEFDLAGGDTPEDPGGVAPEADDW